eukprot:3591935-Amphidinium_carterae.1
MQTSISQLTVKSAGSNAMEQEDDLARQRQACAELLGLVWPILSGVRLLRGTKKGALAAHDEPGVQCLDDPEDEDVVEEMQNAVWAVQDAGAEDSGLVAPQDGNTIVTGRRSKGQSLADRILGEKFEPGHVYNMDESSVALIPTPRSWAFGKDYDRPYTVPGDGKMAVTVS